MNAGQNFNTPPSSATTNNRKFFNKRKENVKNYFKYYPEKTTAEEEKCAVCSRRICAIYCTKCKNFFVGRLKKFCPNHPSRIYLYDFSQCPSCTAGGISDMVECADIDPNVVKQINAVKEKENTI